MYLSTNDEAQAQDDGFTFTGKSRVSSQGGGVGAYISSSVPFHRRLDLEEDIECIWLGTLFPKTEGFLVGIIYRQPDLSKYLYPDFNCKFDSMLSTVSSEDKECILTGDINWNFLVYSDHKGLQSILASFGLKQLITTHTRITPESQLLIDVVCCNEPHHIYCTKEIPPGLSDHELIGCARILHNVNQPRVITCRNYANYTPQLFCNDLRSKDFGNVFASSCVNKAWSFLKNSLLQCIDKDMHLLSRKKS